MFEYKASLVKVVDGDTIDVDLDLGFGVWLKKQRVRLYGINTPESWTRDLEEKKRGLAAKDRVIELIENCEELSIKTILNKKARGKYGRILADILADGINVNQTLVSEGHAVEYFGGKRWLLKSKTK